MPQHRPEVIADAAAAADVLVGILADHMEPIEFSGEAAADAEGRGRGRIALLVNRPGVTFGGLRNDDDDDDGDESNKKGQQWIAKVMEPEQEAFERARFERIRERAGALYAPEPIGSLAGCLYDGRPASILVQVRAPRGTAEDALRAYEDAMFADDWQLWASLEAFLRLRAPQAARAAAAAIRRADATASYAPSSSDPIEWLRRRLGDDEGRDEQDDDFAALVARADAAFALGLLESFVALSDPAIEARLRACSDARVDMRVRAHRLCLEVLDRAGLAQADYGNLNNFALSAPPLDGIDGGMRMLDMGETVDVDALPEARAIWAARYAEAPPCSCAEVLLSAARRRRPDISFRMAAIAAPEKK